MFTGIEDTSEADLFGTEFEVRLCDDLIQWKLAKKYADWLRENVNFRFNVFKQEMPRFINVGEKPYALGVDFKVAKQFL